MENNNHFTQDMINNAVIGILMEVEQCAKIEKMMHEVEESFSLIRRFVLQFEKEPSSILKNTVVNKLYDQLSMYEDILAAFDNVVKAFDNNIANKNAFISLISTT